MWLVAALLFLFAACRVASSLDASAPALTSTNVEGPYSASKRANDAETKSDTLILLPLADPLDIPLVDEPLLLGVAGAGGLPETSEAIMPQRLSLQMVD